MVEGRRGTVTSRFRQGFGGDRFSGSANEDGVAASSRTRARRPQALDGLLLPCFASLLPGVVNWRTAIA
jgi:hypothetical protein